MKNILFVIHMLPRICKGIVAAHFFWELLVRAIEKVS